MERALAGGGGGLRHLDRGGRAQARGGGRGSGRRFPPMLRTHRVAQGPVAPGTRYDAALLNAYADGTTGVRPELALRLVTALNEGELPVVRTLGSIGQADLAPMADLAMGLFAETASLGAGEGLALVRPMPSRPRGRRSRCMMPRRCWTRSRLRARCRSRGSPRTARSSTRPSASCGPIRD